MTPHEGSPTSLQTSPVRVMPERSDVAGFTAARALQSDNGHLLTCLRGCDALLFLHGDVGDRAHRRARCPSATILPLPHGDPMFFDTLITGANNLVWSLPLVGLLLLTGLYFSLRTLFLQVRCIPDMLSQLKKGEASPDGTSTPPTTPTPRIIKNIVPISSPKNSDMLVFTPYLMDGKLIFFDLEHFHYLTYSHGQSL